MTHKESHATIYKMGKTGGLTGSEEKNQEFSLIMLILGADMLCKWVRRSIT